MNNFQDDQFQEKATTWEAEFLRLLHDFKGDNITVAYTSEVRIQFRRLHCLLATHNWHFTQSSCCVLGIPGTCLQVGFFGIEVSPLGVTVKVSIHIGTEHLLLWGASF